MIFKINAYLQNKELLSLNVI